MSALELSTFGIKADLDCYPHRSSCLGFKVEPRGFGCQAFIGFLVLELFILVSLFSPTFVINGKINSLESLRRAFITLMVSKPERTTFHKLRLFGAVSCC